jgi:hypothetical protein
MQEFAKLCWWSICATYTPPQQQEKKNVILIYREKTSSTLFAQQDQHLLVFLSSLHFSFSVYIKMIIVL